MTVLNEFKCVLSFVTFSSAPYSATVPEHAPLGSNVLVVECEDVDRFEGVVVSCVCVCVCPCVHVCVCLCVHVQG